MFLAIYIALRRANESYMALATVLAITSIAIFLATNNPFSILSLSDQYEESWKSLYDEWIPESEYQWDERPCFEVYLNDPKDHPEGKHIVDIYVPVKQG